MGASLAIELAEARQGEREGRKAKGRQRFRKVIGVVAVGIAYETQRQVKLIVILPACSGNAAHQRQQPRPNVLRRAIGDEQAVHVADIVRPGRGASRQACRCGAIRFPERWLFP